MDRVGILTQCEPLFRQLRHSVKRDRSPEDVCNCLTGRRNSSADAKTGLKCFQALALPETQSTEGDTAMMTRVPSAATISTTRRLGSRTGVMFAVVLFSLVVAAADVRGQARTRAVTTAVDLSGSDRSGGAPRRPSSIFATSYTPGEACSAHGRPHHHAEGIRSGVIVDAEAHRHQCARRPRRTATARGGSLSPQRGFDSGGAPPYGDRPDCRDRSGNRSRRDQAR